jgi:hypothetical protein
MHRAILISASVALGGCYSGLTDNGRPGAAGQDDGLDDGADGVPGDDAGDDGPAAADGADDEPGDDPFVVPNQEVTLLPFPVRMQNLSALTGATLTHPIFFELYDLRHQLGDHDYSQLVAPDLRWSPQKMQNWVRGLIPVCDSTVVRAKYPDLVADPTPLVRDAFGRDPTANDLAPLQDIADSSQPDATKYQLTCLAVLSSLDFVAS